MGGTDLRERSGEGWDGETGPESTGVSCFGD